MDAFNIMGSAGPSWMSGVQQIGLELLAVMVMVNILIEALKMVRGVPSDFVEVAVRGAIAGFVIMAVPEMATGLASLVSLISAKITSNGAGLTQDAQMDALSAALKGALVKFSCRPAPETNAAMVAASQVTSSNDGMWAGISGAMTAISFLMSPAGIITILGTIFVYAVIIVKFFMLDVLWPIMFSITVFMGVITIPVTFLRELGGLAHYAKQVIAVALWPVVFAVLVGMVQASFPGILRDMASSTALSFCQAMASPDANSLQNFGGAVMTGYMGVLKFLAVCLGVLFMLIKTPGICGAMMGTGDAAQGIAGFAGGLMTGGMTSVVGKGLGALGAKKDAAEKAKAAAAKTAGG